MREASMRDDWYYQIMGQEFGPVSGSELLDRFTRGDVPFDTLVRRARSREWVLIDKLQEMLDRSSEGDSEITPLEASLDEPEPKAKYRQSQKEFSDPATDRSSYERERRDRLFRVAGISVYLAGVLGSALWYLVFPPQRRGIEIDWLAVMLKWTFLVMLLGAGLRGFHYLTCRNRIDRFVVIAWCTSSALALSWLCIFTIVLFSMGNGPEESVALAMLCAGLFGGFAYGIWALYKMEKENTKQSLAVKSSIQLPSEISARTPIQPTSFGVANGLFWFCVGLVGAYLIGYVVFMIAELFRGPVIGMDGLKLKYARDQTPIDMCAVAGVIIVGGIMSWLASRTRISRGLSVGLFIGTLALGLMAAFYLAD